jgi:hypothetical protein
MYGWEFYDTDQEMNDCYKIHFQPTNEDEEEDYKAIAAAE